MRAPVGWLREYVSLPDGVTAEQVGDALLRVGLETEDVHSVPPTTGPLVVGRVLQIEELTGYAKPIRYCTVDVGPGNGPGGGDEPRGIICGATNFMAGDRVVVALPGAVLPGGFAITARRTYDHISDGMICSVRELGIGTEHDGILVLDGDAVVGADARSVIGADDAVIELAITADRGYALSIRGLAREAGAALDVPFVDPAAPAGGLPVRSGSGWPVTIADPVGCKRFVTVRVTGVNPAAAPPFWMRHRLQQAGIRSISLAVDVTNYVMIEYGQPLHAFDAAKLTGAITVRRAAAGEALTTLDGSVRTLVPDDLVVADESGAISLAGVMGGESTEISAGTSDVVIEAAWWEPTVIYRVARRHRLPSEASRRFERAVDPAIAAVAAEAAAALLVRYGGGEVAGRSDVGAVPAVAPIELPVAEVERLVGQRYPVEAVTRRLAQVGCTIAAADAVGDSEATQVGTGGDVAAMVTVVPPTWRPDLTRPADLVEEVARLEGYEHIPALLPPAPPGRGLTARQHRRRTVAADLASAGLVETLSFPFVGTGDFDALGFASDDPRRSASRLLNPLDAARPYLATTLLPGLLDVAVRNIARGNRDLALFEIGQVVLPGRDAPQPPVLPVDRRPDDAQLAVADASLPVQPRHMAVVLAGPADRPGWWGSGRPASWADAVQLARRIVDTCGSTARVVAAELPPWHPGRCARIAVGDWPIGHAGELHPAVCERLGLPPRSAALELDIDAIPMPGTPSARHVSPFPAVNVDLAVVVRDDVPAAEVTAALLDGGGDLLESLRLFDVYTGDQLPAGTKSLAFSMVVRAADRTLTTAEATAVRDAALSAAADRVGAALRG